MLDKATIRNADELIEHGVTWNHEPIFEFATEVAALETVKVLGEQLRATREQVNQIMRWIEAAVPAARHNGEGETQPQAIINHSGLARQTVYDILKKETAVQNTQRLAEQITPTLGDKADDFDIPGIADLIGETFGFDVNIDDIPSEKYWEIVQKYDTTEHDAV